MHRYCTSVILTGPGLTSFMMEFSTLKLLFFIAFINFNAITADDSDAVFDGATAYSPTGAVTKSEESSPEIQKPGDFVSSALSDTTPEEPLPPPSSALANLGPLLSLIQPVLGGILNGPEAERGAMYQPILKPLFSPLPILPGFGILPASIAAQASDLVASAAASARGLFANAAKENAVRSQTNYGHILTAINELNMPYEEEPESRK